MGMQPGERVRTKSLANSGNGYLGQRVGKHVATETGPPRLSLLMGSHIGVEACPATHVSCSLCERSLVRQGPR